MCDDCTQEIEALRKRCDELEKAIHSKCSGIWNELKRELDRCRYDIMDLKKGEPKDSMRWMCD